MESDERETCQVVFHVNTLRKPLVCVLQSTGARPDAFTIKGLH